MSSIDAAAGVATPSQAYARGAAQGLWQDDPAQHPALAELDRIHAGLLAAPAEAGLLGRLLGRHKAEPVRGLYYWGEVGRGKTVLVDLFYEGLPLPTYSVSGQGRNAHGDTGGGGKYRTHFHRFMRGVHDRLRVHAGESDPLARIVRDVRGKLRVLVLDEFFVTDIGDAMLLARLLDRMFAAGITLVTTSNTAPENLYRDGLQRAGFLPAIAQLLQHCVVLRSGGEEDYRLRALTRSPVYRAPLDAGGDAWLGERWTELSAGTPIRDGNIVIDERKIPVRGRGKGIVWLDFAAACEGPRGTGDYIEIAREFHTVLLGGIPRFDRLNEDAARRFVNLIDELYDRHVNLVCTADALPTGLYSGSRLQGAFERTASRLIEMQSADYLATQHKA